MPNAHHQQQHLTNDDTPKGNDVGRFTQSATPTAASLSTKKHNNTTNVVKDDDDAKVAAAFLARVIGRVFDLSLIHI